MSTAVCIFDDCDRPAEYRVTARWPDGKTWSRNVCPGHMPRGVESLQRFRPPDAGEPTLTQAALRTISRP
jgi:hypothetical protein